MNNNRNYMGRPTGQISASAQSSYSSPAQSSVEVPPQSSGPSSIVSSKLVGAFGLTTTPLTGDASPQSSTAYSQHFGSMYTPHNTANAGGTHYSNAGQQRAPAKMHPMIQAALQEQQEQQRQQQVVKTNWVKTLHILARPDGYATGPCLRDDCNFCLEHPFTSDGFWRCGRGAQLGASEYADKAEAATRGVEALAEWTKKYKETHK